MNYFLNIETRPRIEARIGLVAMIKAVFHGVALCGVVMGMLAGSAMGASCVTKTGRTLDEAEIIGINGGYALVMHSTGVEVLCTGDLPAELLDVQDVDRETLPVLQTEKQILLRKCIEFFLQVQRLTEANRKLSETQVGIGPGTWRSLPAAPSIGARRQATSLVTPAYVAAEEIERDFLTNQAEADRKYKGFLLKVSGVIKNFDAALLNNHTMRITLKSATGEIDLAGTFFLEDLFRSYIRNMETQRLDIRQNEKRIVLLTLARKNNRVSWIEDKTVMRVGENILFDGTCEGLSVTTVKFSNCKKLDLKAARLASN